MYASIGKNVAVSTLRDTHMLLHEIMQDAVKANLIPENPTVGTVIPKAEKKEKSVLNDEQLKTFLSAVKDDEIWGDFFYTELLTGLRRGEICALSWDDFDEAEATLKIEKSLKYVHGQPVIGQTKTETGSRTIHLPESVKELLAERKKHSLTEWIFPNPLKPELPVNPYSAYTKLKKILKEAELPDIRFHDLRHTFATHAAASGVDPKTLSEILGHTKASFTLDTYTHVTTDMQKSASKTVENMITDIFGKELKPWQSGEKTEKEH